MGSNNTRLSPRQKMINLMYIVLTAMLALNVSSDVLNGFTQVEEGLKRTNTNVEERNSAILNTLEAFATQNPDKGKRWFDMLRAAKRNKFQNKQIIIEMILSGADVKQQAILKTKVYDTLSYYLPIAEHELIYNQNLVQNPYYDK